MSTRSVKQPQQGEESSNCWDPLADLKKNHMQWESLSFDGKIRLASFGGCLKVDMC